MKERDLVDQAYCPFCGVLVTEGEAEEHWCPVLDAEEEEEEEFDDDFERWD